MIIGCGGAGKTTLAFQLHDIIKIELIHLDQHYWQANWVETDKAIWAQRVEELSDKASWIIDGNYGGTMEIRFQKADTIIFLDRSKWICIYRVLKRVILNYGRTRKDMAKGCKEHFSWTFIRYIYHYNKTRRPKILEKLEQYKGQKAIYQLRSNSEIKEFLEAL